MKRLQRGVGTPLHPPAISSQSHPPPPPGTFPKRGRHQSGVRPLKQSPPLLHKRGGFGGWPWAGAGGGDCGWSPATRTEAAPPPPVLGTEARGRGVRQLHVASRGAGQVASAAALSTPCVFTNLTPARVAPRTLPPAGRAGPGCRQPHPPL